MYAGRDPRFARIAPKDTPRLCRKGAQKAGPKEQIRIQKKMVKAARKRNSDAAIFKSKFSWFMAEYKYLSYL